MNTTDKAQRLSERANVSYAEACAALEAADGDLLDAMILLEQQGKAEAPGQSSYSTTYEEQMNYIRVQDKVFEQQRKHTHVRRDLGQLFRRILTVLRDNSLCIRRGENILFALPAWIFVIILLAVWKTVIPVMIIALFFGIRYSISGPDDSTVFNNILDKAGNLADDVKKEFH